MVLNGELAREAPDPVPVVPAGALQLPAHINVANARLPATYEQARSALLHCTSIDECQEWANNAEALAANCHSRLFR